MNPPVVLITGVTSGIGQATSAFLASKGMRVFGTVLEPVEGLRQHPDGYQITTMDVRDDESVKRAVDAVLSSAHRIDVLVDNAGVGFMAPLEEIGIDDARRLFEVNTLGPLRMVQAVLPQMRAQRRGLIINITSIGGQIAIPFDGICSASKFALEGLSEALSLELRRFGIDVAIIEPGDINTGMTARSAVERTIDEASPYAHDLTRALAAAQENEREGSSPQRIATLVETLISARRPALRSVGGTVTERLMIPVKHLLPARFFERLVARQYGLGSSAAPSDRTVSSGR
jgi:NAD(P)-dependent dehydrogenase (short-subunit alcohol dehydrogenase family)